MMMAGEADGATVSVSAQGLLSLVKRRTKVMEDVANKLRTMSDKSDDCEVADGLNDLADELDECLEDAIRHLAVGRMPDSRAQAVALIHEQFMRSRPDPSKKGKHYYGAQELKELLDAIYGGPPATDAEKIKGSPMGGFDKVR